MNERWRERLVATIEARMRDPSWRDSLWLRVSDGSSRPYAAVFAHEARDDVRAPDEMPLRIASVTKVYVAAAVFRLIEDGRLRLDDPVDAVLGAPTVAQLRSGGYDAARITIEQLLRHTSGMTDHSISDAFTTRLKREPAHRWTRAEQVDIAMGLGGPLGDPGSAFVYSDTGYVLLGEVVERASDKSLPDAVATLLDFAGLGLVRTRFDGGAEGSPAESTPLAQQWMGDVDATAFDASFDLFGGGGLVSTLHEIDVFFRGLFEGRVFERAETLARIAAAVPTDCGFDGYGHNGLAFRKRVHGIDCWGHTGFWGVLAAYLPERRAMLAATFNRSREDGAYDADALLDDAVAAAG